MIHLEISSSIREANEFENVILNMLRDSFEFESSNVAVSKQGFDDDEQDEIDELEEEATAALDAAGLQEYEITQIDDF